MNDSFSGLFNMNNEMMTIVLTIIAITIVVSIIRSVFRMITPVIIIGLVMVVFLGHSPDDVINKGKQFASVGTNFIQNSILPFINDRDDKDSIETSPGHKSLTKEELEEFFNEDDGHTIEEIFEGH